MMRPSSQVLTAQANLIAEAIGNGDPDEDIEYLVDVWAAILAGDRGILVEVALFFTNKRPDLVPPPA
jgi:hypothetical protein